MKDTLKNKFKLNQTNYYFLIVTQIR